MIRLTCRGCDKTYNVSDENAGKTILCPHCGGRVAVPSLMAGAPPIAVPNSGTKSGLDQDDDDEEAREPKRRRSEKNRSVDDSPRRAISHSAGNPKYLLLGVAAVACLTVFMTCGGVGIYFAMRSANAVQIAKINEAQKPLDAGMPIQPPQFQPEPFQPPQFQPAPVDPPVMPKNPPLQDVGEGTFLVQSITRVTDLAAVTNSIRGYGYNDGISIFAAWVNAAQNVTMGTPLNADTDYVFLAAGDNDARIIGLEIINPFGAVVAWDRRDNSEAMVTFRPRVTGVFTVKLTLIRADNNVPCICSAVILKRNGWNVAFQNLDNATLSLSNLVAELNRNQGPGQNKRIGFRNAPGQWAVYGGVLNQGVDVSVSNLTLGIGQRYLVGVGDGTSTSLDLQLFDKDNNLIGQSNAVPKNRPFFLHQANGSGQRLLIRNVTSPRGASLVMMAALDCHGNPQEQGNEMPREFTNSIGMKFVWIPPGSFTMGSPKEENGRKDNEQQHKVTLTRGFYMGVHLVTQEHWQAIMGTNPSEFKEGMNLPVEQVSWASCKVFCKKMREKDQKPYRLPTEAEWEYACRAGTTTPFHFGETISFDQANYDGNGKKKTTLTGSFPANAWGLHDMHGNVWQWCQDWYGDYPQNDVVDPQGPVKGQQRVLRGGSWKVVSLRCRSAYRLWLGPASRVGDIGFRVCFSPH